MKRDGYLKLVGEVRDMQIVDCDGARCGIADDIELDGFGKTLKVKALLVGPGRLSREAAGLGASCSEMDRQREGD